MSFLDELVVDQVLLELGRHDLRPELLALEITESTLIVDPERAAEILARLRGIGARVSIHDYGTGYCSPAYLRDLPIDEPEARPGVPAGLRQRRASPRAST